jgi:hypothetical protein
MRQLSIDSLGESAGVLPARRPIRRGLAYFVLLAVASCATATQDMADDPGTPGAGDDGGGSVDGGHGGDAAATTGNDAGPPGPDGRDAAGDATTTDAAAGDAAPSTDAEAGLADDAAIDAGADAPVDAAMDVAVDASDAGLDTGAPDTGVDTGAPDAAIDTGVTDSGSVGFGRPVQIDVSAILTVDTVANDAPGDAGAATIPNGGLLTAMDGSGYDLYTSTLGTAHGASGGLPPTGFFAASGATHPDVQLHVSDTATASNSVILNGPSPNNGLTLTFSVPSRAYEQIQIYGTSTEGTSPLTVTLTYADASTSTASITIPDWATNAATAPVFVLAGSLGRVGVGVFEKAYKVAVYGANLGPVTTKALASVTVARTGGGNGRFVFYGATGW